MFNRSAITYIWMPKKVTGLTLMMKNLLRQAYTPTAGEAVDIASIYSDYKEEWNCIAIQLNNS